MVIMAGGTGGHVFPGLAVAELLRSRGHQVTWLGTRNGLEARLVPEHGLPIEWIHVAGLRGKGLVSWVSAPWKLVRAVYQAWRVLHRLDPQLVLGMGGFAAGPGGLAAWLQRRPLVIHEQNAVAGYTNRLLARLARRVLEAFPGTFPSSVEVSTVGNPVRASILDLPEPQQRMAGRNGRIRVLILGGSLGARALNRRVPEAMARLPEALLPEIWHQGGRTVDEARQAYAGIAETMGNRLKVAEFISDMSAAYGWADLVICRAGALTVAELAAAGLASILVPFPHAVDDHQTVNGRYLVEAGAAVLIQERDMSADRLAQSLLPLLEDRSRLMSMACQARARAWPRATIDIADSCQAEVAEGAP